jgi:hypothetical protein
VRVLINAEAAGTVSTISFVAGGVLLAGGLALYLTAPSGKGTGGTARVIRLLPAPASESCGLGMEGAF